jgi:hypothetical protein
MLGRQDPQMDLADAVLWTGKIAPKPLVEKGSFHDRFAAVRATILRDKDFEHWLDAEQGRRSIPPSLVAERSCWRCGRGAATVKRSSGCATTCAGSGRWGWG